MTLPQSEKVREMVAGILDKFGVPGAGIAIVSGEESDAWGYGVCEKGTTQNVTADTTFQLASCSKAYTATTAAILVDRGEIAWDDPVKKHLPEFQMHDDKLSEIATLRDLLSMRLGYRNEGIVNWARNAELGVETIFERLRYLEVIAGFREMFTYLNPAYTLMAEVIARKTGKPFIAFQQEALHAPLGQTNTFVCEGKYLPRSSHAFPHVLLDGTIEPLGEARCGGRIGESCVYSSANDAARWMRFHLQKGELDGTRLVSRAAMDEMHTPQVNGPAVASLDQTYFGYAMGWQCRDTPHGRILVHEGGEFGVSTLTMLDPKRMNGACIYLNMASGAAIRAVVYTLIDLLAGREPRDWAPLFTSLTAQDQAAMRNYLDTMFVADAATLSEVEIAGSYFHPANGVADIVALDGGRFDFRLRDGWVYDGVLEPLGGNLFRAKQRYKGMRAMAQQADSKVQFRRDEQGMALHAPGFGVLRKLDPAVH